MAWRPYENLIEGELDNTVPGKVTGWMRFVGMDEKVILDLTGDFYRDIRGAKLCLTNPDPAERNAVGFSPARSGTYMEGFDTFQVGKVGDITAGLPPADYVSYPYIEWFSKTNGRVVIELDSTQVEVVGEPLFAATDEPVSREKQYKNMVNFLRETLQAVCLPEKGHDDE